MTALLARLLGRLPIGWLQLRHNRTRLVAAVGGVTFANVLIFMQLGFMGALFESSVKTHHQLRADVVVTSADYSTLREASPLPRARLWEALGQPGVIDATDVFLGTVVWSDPVTGDTFNLRLLGVDPDANVFHGAEVQALLPRLRQADTVLLDRRTRAIGSWIVDAVASGAEPGIELGGRHVDVVGLFELGAAFDVDGTLIVSAQTFFRLSPRRSAASPTMVLVTTEPGVDPQRVADELSRAFPESDSVAYSKAGFVAVEQAYQARQSPIGFVFGFGVVIGLIVGLVIVYQVLSSDVQDHLAEYATFKAIGYGPRFFLGIVFEEAVALAALGFVPGVAISLALYAVAARATALPISMPWTRPVLVFALTVTMCALSGAIATRKLNAADPADLF